MADRNLIQAIIYDTALGALRPAGVAPLAAIQMTPTVAGEYVGALIMVLGLNSGAGQAVTLTGLPTDSDGILVSATSSTLPTLSMMMGFEAASGQFNRVRVVQNNADGLAFDAVGGALLSGAVSLFNNGATLDRGRSASAVNLATFDGVGAAVGASPGEWPVEARPAAGLVATATRAAGGVGVRNVCRSITTSLISTAAQTQVDVVVRDGITGVGTILWSARFAGVIGTSSNLGLSGLNIVGSANTAMTIEFLAAPAATNFQGVAMTGCLAS